LGSFQIQTFPFLFSLFPSFQLRRAEFLFPIQPSWPNQQRIPAQQPSFEPATPFSRRQTGPACRSTFYPLPCFPHLGSAPHRAAAPRPRVRGTGHFPPSGRPACRGTGARSHASRIRPGRGNTSFTPCHTHLCNLACAKGGTALPRPPGRSKPGQLGVFTSQFAVPGFKSEGGGRDPDVQATNPIGVFPFHFS
jgi:hypothetical protein